jgi:hypothetical protein
MIYARELTAHFPVVAPGTPSRALVGKLGSLYRTLCEAILKQVVKRLPYRILSLERATNPEGVGDE